MAPNWAGRIFVRYNSGVIFVWNDRDLRRCSGARSKKTYAFTSKSAFSRFRARS